MLYCIIYELHTLNRLGVQQLHKYVRVYVLVAIMMLYGVPTVSSKSI